MSPDPKRHSPRIKDTDLLRLRKLASDECELCGRTQNLNQHHVIFRSQGGGDVTQNLVCLCTKCHTDYHRWDEMTVRRLGFLVASQRTDVLDYIRSLRGEWAVEGWLVRHGIYP